MLQPGTQAPDFALTDENGKEVSLSGLVSSGPLVLYFYPADFTTGCTKEACSIRDLHGELLAAGLKVIGVSPQGHDSHARFRERYNLPFPLLSDPDKTVIKLFDSDGPLGIGVRRTTYLIDTQMNIEDALEANIFIDEHIEFVERAIATYGNEN